MLKYWIALICLICSSCHHGAQRREGPASNPNPIRVAPVDKNTFTEADIDKDGKLTIEEAQTLPKEEQTTFLSAFLYIVCAVLAALVVSVVLTRRCKLANVDNDNKEEVPDDEEEDKLLNETAMVVEPSKTDLNVVDGTDPGGNVVK